MKKRRIHPPARKRFSMRLRYPLSGVIIHCESVGYSAFEEHMGHAVRFRLDGRIVHIAKIGRGVLMHTDTETRFIPVSRTTYMTEYDITRRIVVALNEVIEIKEFDGGFAADLYQAIP